mgnify:CR=1 FL=1
MARTIAALALGALALAGCQTTEDAAVGLQSRWIGQPVDRFFVENGPPLSSFQLGDGSTIYTWRGGEMSYVQPAQVISTPVGPSQPLTSTTSTRTTTSRPAPGTTVTRTTTTSSSFGLTPTVTTVVQPARTVTLLCEAQITANPDGTITNVRISRDTEGDGFSLSRCADLFAPRS